MNQQFRRRRYPTAFSLTVTTPLGRQKARLIDVNQGGARLEGVENVMRGDRLTLHVLNEQLPAAIRWVAAHRVGVAFLTPAPPLLVDLLRQGIRATVAGRFNSTALREMR